jgi:uncharacterized membrane protein YbhN (UPF0104 family)
MTPITNRLPGFGAAEAARKRSSLLIKVAVTLVLLVVSLRWVRLDVLAASLRQARPGPLLVAALMLVLGGFAGAASWFCILRARLPSMRFRDAAACHWSGMFFNSFLPSNVGGDVVKGYLVMRNGAPAPSGETSTAPTWRVVVTSLLLDRALNLAMLLGIGGFALLIDRHGWGMAVTAAGAVLVALPLVSMAARRCAVPAHDVSEGSDETGWRDAVRALFRAACAFAGAPRRLVPLLLAALASQVLKTWSNLFIIRALGLAIPSLTMWMVIPLFGVVSALPISIGGLGVRELTAQAVSGPLGLDNTHLVALSLAGHALVTAVSMLGAIPLLTRRRNAGGARDQAMRC